MGTVEEIAGIAPIANVLWMSQIERNLTDADDGILKGKCYLIHYRDPLFAAESLRCSASPVSCRSNRPRSPSLFAERWVRSGKEECLSHLILVGEASLRKALNQFQKLSPRRRASFARSARRPAPVSRFEAEFEVIVSAAALLSIEARHGSGAETCLTLDFPR
jgi:hypothetical protein